jgi:hypothetical protein
MKSPGRGLINVLKLWNPRDVGGSYPFWDVRIILNPHKKGLFGEDPNLPNLATATVEVWVSDVSMIRTWMNPQTICASNQILDIIYGLLLMWGLIRVHDKDWSTARTRASQVNTDVDKSGYWPRDQLFEYCPRIVHDLVGPQEPVKLGPGTMNFPRIVHHLVGPQWPVKLGPGTKQTT